MMNWGKWIIVSFLLFAVFIGALVVICVREDISLVSRDYYPEEIAYQAQIDRLNNTNRLKEKPIIRVVNGTLEIEFSEFGAFDRGELKLFCPSNVKFDKLFSVPPSTETIQRFDISSLPEGMYRARLKWSMNGAEYYIETMVTL